MRRLPFPLVGSSLGVVAFLAFAGTAHAAGECEVDEDCGQGFSCIGSVISAGSGAGGAPKLTDKAHWASRIALGAETLVKHATDGFTGSLGMMPARGGNAALNDEQVKATVEWMIEQAR